MRLVLLPLLTLILAVSPVYAQSVTDNLPAGMGGSDDADSEAPAPVKEIPAAPVAETYTVADVNADVTADNSTHARDQALIQAQRSAFSQLCGRLGIPDSSAKLDDDTIAGMVQSFEVQSEHLSAVRYIGVFTIRFKPAAVQKKMSKALATANAGMGTGVGVGSATADVTKAPPSGPLSHVTVAVQTDSLAAWTQIKKRINAVPQVATVGTLDLARGVSHIDLAYGGSTGDLQSALTVQGLVLRQAPGGMWELTDGSMVPR